MATAARLPLDADLVGFELPPLDWRWEPRDVALYALGVGAGVERDLALVFERHGPLVLPTFATLPVAMLLPATVAAIEIDLRRLLHIQQSVAVAVPLPPSGRALVSRTVLEVLDKGRAAIVTVEDVGRRAGGEERFRARSSWWVSGAGGFASSETPSRVRLELPARAPDASVTWRTSRDQAALYRLSGDRNPIHIDPQFAREAGFERPFLHGLCTFGAAGLALVRELCGGDPRRLRALAGLLSARVEPGEELRTDLWRTGPGTAALHVRAEGRTVLDEGQATFAA